MNLASRLRGLLASADQVDAAQERKEHSKQSGVIPIATAKNRTHGCYSGIIRSIVLHPRAGNAALEVELYDGSGALAVVWLGRRAIAGIEPGARMRVTGLVTINNGRPVMFNPRYELKARIGETP